MAEACRKNSSCFNNPALIVCKAPKTAACRSITYVTRLFSTLFFTELLKTSKKNGNGFAKSPLCWHTSTIMQFFVVIAASLNLPVRGACARMAFSKVKAMAGKNKPATKTSGRKTRRNNAKTRSSPAKVSANGKAAPAVLNSDKLKDLCSTMLKCRMLQEKMQTLVSEKKLGQPIAGAAGHEAVLVGAIAHLVPADSITLAQGGCIASYIKGTPLKSIVAQLLKSRVGAAGRGAEEENRHVSPAKLSIAKGLKLADDVKEKARVAMVFPGADETALAFLHDALTLAAKYKQPLICLTETSLLSEPDPPYPPPNPPESHSPQITVDGTDVVAIFRVAQEAVRRARAGHGPSLIECVMPSEAATQRESRDGARDPLAFIEQYLRRRDLWSDEWRRKIIDDISKEMEEAITSAGESSASEVPFDHVYSADGVSAHLELSASLPS